MSVVTGDPGLPPDETRAAGALLSAAWGERAAVLTAEALRDRTHVFRLRLDGGRSAVLKRRGADREAGTTTIRPRLLAWLRSFAAAAVARQDAPPAARPGRRDGRGVVAAVAAGSRAGIPGAGRARRGAGPGA